MVLSAERAFTLETRLADVEQRIASNWLISGEGDGDDDGVSSKESKDQNSDVYCPWKLDYESQVKCDSNRPNQEEKSCEKVTNDELCAEIHLKFECRDDDEIKVEENEQLGKIFWADKGSIEKDRKLQSCDAKI